MSGTGPVGVGIIGAGVISTQYLDNLSRTPDVRVLMIADLDESRAAARAAEYGIAHSGSVADLLARDDVEIVVNLTIPAAHVAVGLDALAAGKHVFSEKPLALDRESGRALLTAAEAGGLRVACAPDTMLGAGLQTGFRLLAADAIGEPLTALALFQVSGPESWHPSPEFLFARGGGPLFDMGPYYLSTLVHALGSARRVIARGSTSRHERVIGSGPRAGTRFPVEVPTHVAGLIDFDSGASAQITLSFQSALPRVGVVEVTGTAGALAFPDPNTFDGDLALWRDGAFEAETVAAVGSTLSRGAGVVDLARAIRAGRPERVSGAFALHVVDLLCSLEESATHGNAVELTTSAPATPPLPEEWDPLAATL